VSAVVVLGNLVLNIPHFTAKVKAFIPRLVSTYEEDTDENTIQVQFTRKSTKRSKMMKIVKFLPVVLLIGLSLALAGSMGLGFAQGPEPPEGEVQPQGEASIAATVAAKFSYQGVLKENDSPVTGSRDMTFRLYSDDTCSTQVGDDIAKPGVPVSDGLFSVELGAEQQHIYGQGLWLEVEVGGTKIGCQEILPVPYAYSLIPGAIISDTSSYAQLNRYESQGAPYYHSWKYGVYAKSEGTGLFTSHYGVYGSGTDYGVYGYSDSGAAIYGNGDVKQNLAGNGLVKAAVFAHCGGMGGTIVHRYFNNVTTDPITIAPDGAHCTINFGFDISDRFWVATAVGDNARGVTCQLGSSNNYLYCVRWYGGTGSDVEGDIMVLVY
jgi:hypothetical protein